MNGPRKDDPKHAQLVEALGEIERNGLVPLLSVFMLQADMEGCAMMADFFVHMAEKTLTPMVAFAATIEGMDEETALLRCVDVANGVRDGLLKSLQEGIVTFFKLKAEEQRNPGTSVVKGKEARARLQEMVDAAIKGDGNVSKPH